MVYPPNARALMAWRSSGVSVSPGTGLHSRSTVLSPGETRVIVTGAVLPTEDDTAANPTAARNSAATRPARADSILLPPDDTVSPRFLKGGPEHADSARAPETVPDGWFRIGWLCGCRTSSSAFRRAGGVVSGT